MTNMTELDELERWAKDAGNFPAVSTVARFRQISAEGREQMRLRWRLEDGGALTPDELDELQACAVCDV